MEQDVRWGVLWRFEVGWRCSRRDVCRTSLRRHHWSEDEKGQDHTVGAWRPFQGKQERVVGQVRGGWALGYCEGLLAWRWEV